MNLTRCSKGHFYDKDRFDNLLNEINQQEWEIKEVQANAQV